MADVIFRRPKKQWRDLTETFRKEVYEKASDVDPENEREWHSLTLGWALAKGLEPKEANAFACYIRYETDLG